MNKKIWIMEGLSSQRDILSGINTFSFGGRKNSITTYASHSKMRNEILSIADHAIIEPQDDKERLSFIHRIVELTGVEAIHVGRNCRWFEANRSAIEKYGVSLTTGATNTDTFDIADDKVTFAQFMAQSGLPVVPSVRVNSWDELHTLIKQSPFPENQICIKPVTGIYGKGFWRLDPNATYDAPLSHPENRKINPAQYLSALGACDTFEPLVLMPYLPGPEYSVDILLSECDILSAVGRRKEGAIQYLENSGEAFELACACAKAMKADGLVNVQTRNNDQGVPVLLEINLRPSGGIGYTRHSGINLPGLFASHKLDLLSADDVKNETAQSFTPVAVRSITDVLHYELELKNQLSWMPLPH